jgi:hypothetical protein
MRQRRTALIALCINAFGHGDYPLVVERATRLEALGGDPVDADAGSGGRRFLALARHHLGDHRAAWEDCVHVLDGAGPTPRVHACPQVPEPVSMGIVQARILWLQGRADQALARALGLLSFTHGPHPFALSQALAMAIIPIQLWRGDDGDASASVDRLVDNALRHSQSYWLAWADGYCKVLALRGRDVDALRRQIGPGPSRSLPMASDMLGTLDAALAGLEQLARVEAGTVGWCAPEILRVHGDRLARDSQRCPRAEAMLLRGLALARRQGALAWELRCATSVATLWHATGREGAAHELLAGVLAGIAEGLDCVDPRRAKALLAAWGTVS